MNEYNLNIRTLKDLKESKKNILSELESLSKNKTIILHGEKMTVACAIRELQY